MESFPPQPNHFTWATCYSRCYCYATVLPLCSPFHLCKVLLYNTFHSVDPATLLHVAFCQLLFCCIFHSGVILRCIFLIGQAATLLHILLRPGLPLCVVYRSVLGEELSVIKLTSKVGRQRTPLKPMVTSKVVNPDPT